MSLFSTEKSKKHKKGVDNTSLMRYNALISEVCDMKQTDAIKALLEQNNKKKTWLAEKLGVRQNAISQMLKRGNITVDTLYQICELDGIEYEITIQPKRGPGARPKGQIVIEGRKRSEVRVHKGIDKGAEPSTSD